MISSLGESPSNCPYREDEATTQEIARRVNERIQTIEAASTRIDTQRFALQAAFSLAADLHLLETKVREDERELLRALDQIAGALRVLLEPIE